MMPEPTTPISRNEVPTNSAVTACASVGAGSALAEVGSAASEDIPATVSAATPLTADRRRIVGS